MMEHAALLITKSLEIDEHTAKRRPEVKSLYVTGPCAAMKEAVPVLAPPKESGTAFCRPSTAQLKLKRNHYASKWPA
jgi:hypothetical protein